MSVQRVGELKVVMPTTRPNAMQFIVMDHESGSEQGCLWREFRVSGSQEAS